MMLDRNTESKIVYGNAFNRHLIRIRNVCLTHSHEEIYLFDDDTKGTFRNPKYHPDTATVFAFCISRFLMILLGLTFGFIVSPQDWGPFNRARTYLVEALIST